MALKVWIFKSNFSEFKSVLVSGICEYLLN